MRATYAPSLEAETRAASRGIRIGLLGLGHVGAAVARRALSPHGSLAHGFEITGALVRDPGRRRNIRGIAVTTDTRSIFDSGPDVIVEALGGLEPARTLVLEALARRIPVVTANKSLMARHYDEIVAAASHAGVALRFEASVVAGVPFLGTFAKRPHAAAISSLVGIVNGTTNFILTAMADAGRDYADVLAEAKRRGFAEPNPANDIRGIDAAEKLAILIRQFAGRRVDVDAIETTGIEQITAADIALARELGGVVKPVVAASGLASGGDSAIRAFVAPCLRTGAAHAGGDGKCDQRRLPARRQRQSADVLGAWRRPRRDGGDDPGRCAGGDRGAGERNSDCAERAS